MFFTSDIQNIIIDITNRSLPNITSVTYLMEMTK